MTLKPYPDGLFTTKRKHLFFLAHFDDEAPYAGLISRLAGLGNEVHIAWLTNGDGLAFQTNLTPQEYARSRKRESLCAAKEMGISEQRLHFLDYSEIEIYKNFTLIKRDPSVMDFFMKISEQVDSLVKRIAPDVLWVLAFQGGHPEHDLSHLTAIKAIRPFDGPVFELPEYEYTILLPFRFRPWLDRPVHEILLTESEFKLKNRVVECYPTQKDLIKNFLKVVSGVTFLVKPFVKGMSFDNFLARETFAPVPENRDYTKSTHIHQVFDYMFDDYRGEPIKFNTSIARIAQALGLTVGFRQG